MKIYRCLGCDHLETVTVPPKICKHCHDNEADLGEPVFVLVTS